jgi:hypothetical protein
MDYFREFYGIISSRPKFLAVMAYKLCPKAQNFMEKYGLFPGISWKILQQPGPSLTIAYKPYPRGPEFYGIVWFVYGNFMENLAQS